MQAGEDYGGVMHMLAALDLATGKIYYRIRRRKWWREFFGLLKTVRDCWTGEELYVVLDNTPAQARRSPHLGADNDVGLVFLPTYGSWLNWIEWSSRHCATSPSTAPTTTPRASRTPPSPPTSAGATPTQNQRSPSPPTHPSEPGPSNHSRCLSGHSGVCTPSGLLTFTGQGATCRSYKDDGPTRGWCCRCPL